MKEKSKKLAVAILTGIAALIWIVRCVLDAVYDTPGDAVRILNIVCAIVWCVACATWVIRWRSDRQV